MRTKKKTEKCVHEDDDQENTPKAKNQGKDTQDKSLPGEDQKCIRENPISKSANKADTITLDTTFEKRLSYLSETEKTQLSTHFKVVRWKRRTC